MQSRSSSGHKRRLPRVIHLIPYDWPGGVEVAAATVASGDYGGFAFEKRYLCVKMSDAQEGPIAPENDPRAYVRTFRALLDRRPDVLILSLWRSCLVGLAVKLVRPRTRLVLFLHNSENAHVVDAILTWLSARLADEVWADSASTAARRMRGPVSAISFVAERIGPRTSEIPAPAFIFWGRLHPRKHLARAIALFKAVRDRHAGARFTIIGPDSGDGAALRSLVAALDLTRSVTFHPAADHDEIAHHSADHSFFLQTSRAEGMAMSVVEAMQLGLVPIVTPVGEIGTYVDDGVNGLWITDDDAMPDRVALLLSEPDAFRSMRASALQVWSDKPLYRDEFLTACAEVLKAGGS